FVYDPGWEAAETSYSISPHILLFGQPAATGTVRRFLENLLPEGRALDVVTTTHQVSRNNIYGLIHELGRETSGALAFLPEDLAPQDQIDTRREIRREEISERIKQRAQIPFAAWDGRVRLSIAGHQDKVAVYLDPDQDRMYLVEGALASTHILKPEPAENRLPMLVANEHYATRLAARLGLTVPVVSILRLPDPVLVIERFDRVRETDGVRRLHIIDACQAVNFPVSYKYERNFGAGRDVRHIRDGVSFERLFSISEYTVRKAVTRLSLLRWALFGYLIGNADAHGKNVSFFCCPDGLALAPFYDLVSVVQYDNLDHEMAMAYGDEFRLHEVSPFAWADFAHRTGTSRPLLAREMIRMGKAALEAAPAQARATDYVDDERAFVGQIAAYVQEQAQKLIDHAALMRKVDDALL
ncbi:MAG: HipA domain-containing protein, partial [Gammaproteobacteria bacterium]|nr:HipA domain-containing protein [Gammaproteobacteria bacterium]